MDPDKPSAMFVHCQNVYTAMLANSVETEIVIDDEPIRMYRGFLTKLVQEDLFLTNSYYTYIIGHLSRMDCIRRHRRGGGTSPSEWLLIKEPTPGDFLNSPDKVREMTKLEKRTEQRFRDIEERLDNIDRALRGAR